MTCEALNGEEKPDDEIDSGVLYEKEPSETDLLYLCSVFRAIVRHVGR